jgi:hypothetical protein
MSYNVESIIEENLDKIVINNPDSTKLAAWLVGKCIAQDILSNTCEGRNEWSPYDRSRLLHEICKVLSEKFNEPILLKKELLHKEEEHDFYYI